VLDPGGEPNADTPLRALADRAGIAVGTAVDAQALARRNGYRTELAREFSSVTPENVMKWEVTEPERGKFDFEQADALVDFARDNGMRVRGHTLVWHVQNPAWLRDGRFSRDEMITLLRRHVHTVVGRYRGRVAAWDVVNEPLGDSGRLRESLWYRRIGAEYIAYAFQFAHEADPEATLFVNEIGAEGGGRKSDALYEMVRELRRRGVPVGGVGFESHFSLDGVPPSFRANMQRFAQLGLQVAVTEADVRVRLPASPRELDVQGDIYADAMRDCLAVDACRSFSVWGFTDRHSWIPSNQPGYGAATLLDAELEPKPAYTALRRALISARRR
jgi:endo-1,4-beta-xylanase